MQFTDWSVQVRVVIGPQTAQSVNLYIALKAMFYLLIDFQHYQDIKQKERCDHRISKGPSISFMSTNI